MSPITWQNGLAGGTKLNATNLNGVQADIANVKSAAATAQSAADQAQSTANTALDKAWFKGNLPDGTDLNTLTDIGRWAVRLASDVATIANTPPNAGPGFVESTMEQHGMKAQTWITYGSNTAWRRTTSSVVNGSMTPWGSVDINANAYTDQQVASDRSRLTTNEGKITNHETRIGDLEVIGGLAPGDVSDATVNSLITNPSSSTTAALAAKYVGKGVQVRYSKDYGLIGDGSDEFTKLQSFLQAGGALLFENGKTFSYNPASVISIPANTTIWFNGAKLYELSAVDENRIVFNDGCRFDALDVSFAGGDTARGVLMQGSGIHGDSVKLVARNTGTGGGNYRRRALNVGVEGGSTTNISIDSVYIENWEYGAAVWGATAAAFGSIGVTIGSLKHVSCRQGLLIRDSTSVNIFGGYHKTLSTLCKGNPGENAVLMEATTADHSVSDISINNYHSFASGEHGFRVGGQFQAKNITFSNCYARAAGSGTGSGIEPDNHGGCGFKILGPTTNLSGTARHSNIRLLNCTVESLNQTQAKDNFAGFNIGKAYNVTIANPVVRAAPATGSYAEGTYAAYNGIEIIGSENVTISIPNIAHCANAAVYIYDAANDSVTNWGGGCTYVTVDGGNFRVNKYGMAYANTIETMRSIEIHGTSMEGHQYDIWANPTVSTLNRCYAFFNTKSCTVANTLNTGVIMMEITGDEIGTNTARNGSTFGSYGVSQRKIMANGGWMIQEAVGTTAARPTGATAGQRYFDTTLGKPVWLKTAPSTWVDATGAAA